MFMLKKTHKKAMSDIFLLTKETIDEVKKRAESDRTINQRALDAERSITASLRAEIEAMKPDFILGQKRRAAYEADNAKRKAKRANKPRTASETVSVIGKQTERLNKSFQKVKDQIAAAK